MTRRNLKRAGLLLSATSLGFAVAAQAQSDGQVTAGLADIVVTAQKRSESLQDTPLAISAVTAETIQARGISDVGSLTAIAPNLIINQTPQSSTSPSIYIRGIGGSDPLLTVDSPNGIYVDGVVIGRSTGAMFDLVDLERIEVLRGPQGTLYGRNTSGGAINLITAKPADELGFVQTLGYGRFNLFQSKTTIDTGELGSSGIRAKLTYLHKQRNGYVDNTAEPSRNDPGAYNLDAFRAAVTYDTGGSVTATYAFDYNHRKSRGIPSQLAAMAPFVEGYLAASPAFGGNEVQFSRDRLKHLTLDNDGELTDKVMGHSLTLEAAVSDSLQLRSITGYREWTSLVANSDLAGNAGLLGFTVSPALFAPPYDFIPEGINPVNLYSGTNDRKQHQWSQEINVIGNIGEKMEFVLGGFYFMEKARELDHSWLTIVIPTDDPIDLGPGLSIPAFGVNVATILDYSHKSESKALFGQTTYHLTDRFSVTGGLRYTWDKRTLNQREDHVYDARVKYGQLTWMANAKYDLTDDVSAYVRVSTGYNSGGFNPRGSGNAFLPEKVTSYEAGVKAEMLDNRVRLNLAGFHTVYRDMQVSQFEAGSDGATSVTVNAGKARYTGVEAELLAQLAKGLTLSANAGYVDRKFKEYIIRDPETDQLVNMADVARFGYSASTTVNTGLEYQFPHLGFGQLTARVDYNYRSRMYFHPLDILAPFNKYISDKGVSTFDGRVTLSEVELHGAQMSVAVWGKNLTNKDYLLSGIDFGDLGFASISYAEPRTWGVDVTVRY